MSETFYLSRKNYEKLREELDALKKIKAQLSEEIGEAARQGDLKENAEYAAAKEKQAETLSKINDLEIRLRNTRITDDLDVDRSEARIGATVTIEDLSDGEQSVYTLVGSMESNPEAGLLSVKTPIATGLLGCKEGQIFEMGAELETLANRTIEPFVVLFNKSVELIPGIIVALVMLFLGLFLSRWTSTIVRKLLNAIKLDMWTSKIGVNEILTRIGFGKSPTYVIAFVLSWAVMITFIMIAADSLGLSTIRTLLYNLLAFIPKLFACIVILFAGLLFGRFVENVVQNSAKANNIRGGIFFSKIINAVVVIFAILLALEQININFALINDVILILLASMGLGLAIAFGLGAKDVVADFLKESLKKEEDAK